MGIDRWATAEGDKVRRLCFERDKRANAPCWICNQPIDYSLGMSTNGGSKEAWEPDHRRPRKKYPELALDMANIMPSHMKCNRARGTKAGLNELGTPSRDWVGYLKS
ncbi:MAG: HNH endonuclease [Coriobacteriales bacterium]|nr:HNH endonuclease [Coriobacteriales bacterium]